MCCCGPHAANRRIYYFPLAGWQYRATEERIWLERYTLEVRAQCHRRLSDPRFSCSSAPQLFFAQHHHPNGDNQNQTFVLKGATTASDWNLRIYGAGNARYVRAL
jgi:hypothetical protein